MRIARKIIIAILVILFLMVFIPTLVIVTFQLAYIALFGWISSFIRLVQRFEHHHSSLTWFALAAMGLFFGAHFFLRWVYSHRRASSTDRSSRVWPLRWTACGFGIMACTLIAAACAVLTVHQSFWLARSSEPMFAPVNPYLQFSDAFSIASMTSTNRLRTGQIRARYDRTMLEEARVLVVGEENEPVRAVIVIPRHPLIRSAARVYLMEHGTDVVSTNLNGLPEILDRYGITNFGDFGVYPGAYK
jgi:hypothetical protein